MRWIELRRSKIKVYGQKNRLAFKGLDEEHTLFLHGLLTNDVKGMPPFSVSYHLMLRQNGAPIREFFLYKLQDHYLLDTPDPAKQVIEDLEKRKLSLKVYLEDLTPNYRHIFLLGEDSKDFVEKVWGNAPQEGRLIVEGSVIIAHNSVRFRETGYDLIGELSDLELPESLMMTTEEAENLRIRRCIPAVGKELREGFSPLEAGVLRYAISLNKGCYVGQEAIARVYYRGRTPRTLVLLQAEGLREGEKLFDGDKQVGTVTSVGSEGYALGYVLRVHAQKEKVLYTPEGTAVKLIKVCEEVVP
ncbi:folate-binding protein YgfZ [Thermocrinis albus DSM 14484]|uniref:Folate-binding protein YgfZ n=1 Tax=Thermocrinis albus (strain DSM 14484 / JCM 11386 / HI 11/12) TaxID=638303 RepID=D3SM46_THEAH|nr:folate-binding protein YgfZ [Thermocrinis albus]ADC89826.1 folate-binding protein YgfZ [Thermocrinis albus DSM 14484]